MGSLKGFLIKEAVLISILLQIISLALQLIELYH